MFSPASCNNDCAAMDIVFLQGFRAETVIGVDHDEQHLPQPVCIDLALGRAQLAACHSDRLRDTVDYAAVREAVQTLLAGHRLKLLEALAEAIAQMLLARFELRWVRVRIAKVDKFPDVARAGVQIERHRP